MSKKDTTKQDMRSMLLKNNTIIPSSYVSTGGTKISKEDSMKAAIAARRNTFTTQKKEG